MNITCATAKAHGIKPAAFYARIRRGWSRFDAATIPTRPYFYEWNPT